MGLIDDLGPGPVALDTVVFIYFMEEHREYVPVVAPLFEAIDRGLVAAVCSTLTLMEVLVVPFRAGNLALAQRYEALLTRSRGLRMIDLGRPLLRTAAQLRAVHAGLRTPDALQISTALVGGCRSFLTNDRRLPALPGLRVVQLEAYRATG